MTPRSAAPLLAILLTLSASALPAQHAPRSWLARPGASAALADAPTTSLSHAASPAGRPLAGALLGGAAGVLAGGLAGVFIGGNRCADEGNPDSCQALGGLLLGAAVGHTVGAPVGAHLLNRRQGALPASLLASVAIAGAGVAALWATDRLDQHERNNAAQISVAVAVPILQIVSSAIIEQRTSRR